jgi:hypothetical protein
MANKKREFEPVQVDVAEWETLTDENGQEVLTDKGKPKRRKVVKSLTAEIPVFRNMKSVVEEYGEDACLNMIREYAKRALKEQVAQEHARAENEDSLFEKLENLRENFKPWVDKERMLVEERLELLKGAVDPRKFKEILMDKFKDFLK